MSLRMHPREVVVREAENKIREAVAIATKDLTELEALRAVHSVLSEHVGSFIKYGIRVERHGDAECPGGLE